MAPSLSTDGAKENWSRGQDLNLRPSGYEGDFTQPADGRRPSCFQSSRVVSSSAKSTEGHAGIRKSPPVWTRFGQSSGEPLRTGDLRLGNSEGLDSRTSTALHSEPKASISLETVARPDPQIFHTAPQKHESLGPTGVQDVLFLLQLRRSSSECAPPRSTRCAPVDNCHTFAS